MKIFKQFDLERVAYDHEPLPVVAESRALAFIRLNSNEFRVLTRDSYRRVFVREDTLPSGTVVYCGRVISARCRTGFSFSDRSPLRLLQTLYDFIFV